ncbi:MAG: 4Fe-4S binding protein [Desulfobacterales bacterium]|nr:4Fe-4S binding protein [Desulfobacterales bacterium]
MNPDAEYNDVKEFEAKPIEERWAYFTKEMEKCMRCNACRQACPSCYCPTCFVEQSQPQWVGIGEDKTRYSGISVYASVSYGRTLRGLRFLRFRLPDGR